MIRIRIYVLSYISWVFKEDNCEEFELLNVRIVQSTERPNKCWSDIIRDQSVRNSPHSNHLQIGQSIKMGQKHRCEESRICHIWEMHLCKSNYWETQIHHQCANPLPPSKQVLMLDDHPHMIDPVHYFVLFIPFGQIFPCGHMDNYDPMITVIYLHLWWSCYDQRCTVSHIDWNNV